MLGHQRWFICSSCLGIRSIIYCLHLKQLKLYQKSDSTGRVPNLGQCLKLGHLQLCIEKIQIFMKIFLFNKLIPIQHTLKIQSDCLNKSVFL